MSESKPVTDPLSKEEYLGKIREIESIDPKYSHEISNAFQEFAQENEASLTDDQKKSLEWEFLLFRLSKTNRYRAENTDKGRFIPMMTYTNGAIFPDPNGFPPEAFEYFKSRAKQTSSPVFKARYSDFIWDRSNLKKDKHLYAIQAIRSYLDVSAAIIDEDRIFTKLDALGRALALALTIESKVQEKELTPIVVTAIKKEIETYLKEGKFRWLIDLIEFAAMAPEEFGKDSLHEYLSICDQAIEFYGSENNFHLQRSFLDLKTNVAKKIGLNDEVRKIKVAEAESYVLESETRTDSALVQVTFLEKAIKLYNELGEKKRAEELITRMKKAGQEAIGEFKEFSQEVKVPQKEIDRLKLRLGTGYETPTRIGLLPDYRPDWQEAIRLTEELNKKYPLTGMLPRQIFGEEYPIYTPKTEQEQQEDKVMSNFAINNRVKLQYLTAFLMQLKNEKKIQFKHFKRLFRKLEAIDPDLAESVYVGLKDFFHSRYYQSVCVLVPLFEDFLRDLVKAANRQTTIQSRRGFEEKTLGLLIKELEAELPDGIPQYLNWVLIDYRGLNLRNNTAHGFLKKSGSDPLYAVAVIHLFCLILVLMKVEVKKKSKI